MRNCTLRRYAVNVNEEWPLHPDVSRSGRASVQPCRSQVGSQLLRGHQAIFRLKAQWMKNEFDRARPVLHLLRHTQPINNEIVANGRMQPPSLA
jgi:hypothetical protein